MNYDWWRRALAGEKVGGETLPIHDGDPQLGFFRRRLSSGGAYTGVAIFEHEGQIVALKGNQAVDAQAEWTHCCHHPVTEEAYREWEKSGKWPDEDTAMKESLAHNLDNQGPTDQLSILKEQIESALGGVSEYADINSDETAARAQSLRSRLLELSGKADKEREVRVRPHLDAEKAINKDWMPLVKESKGGADEIRKAMSLYETRQKTLRDAEAAKAAAAERERLRLLAEAAARAEAEGKPLPPPPEPTPAPPPVEAPKTQVRGGYGRAASKKLIRKAIVEDYDEATTYFRNALEYRAVIDKLAQRAVDAGQMPPGVKIEEHIDVR